MAKIEARKIKKTGKIQIRITDKTDRKRIDALKRPIYRAGNTIFKVGGPKYNLF